jgi:putative oxidoreductase
MSEAWAVNLGLLIARVAVGVVMLAHGYNHIFGGGKIPGTARWFGSMGMRPPLLHAWLASVVELGAGVLLVFGLFTPLAAAGAIGVMGVAFAINHAKNGFFIFRPGEGYEYVMTLALVSLAVAVLGAGGWSLDRAFGIDDNLDGGVGLAIALIGGIGGTVLTLAVSWRPPRRSPS